MTFWTYFLWKIFMSFAKKLLEMVLKELFWSLLRFFTWQTLYGLILHTTVFKTFSYISFSNWLMSFLTSIQKNLAIDVPGSTPRIQTLLKWLCWATSLGKLEFCKNNQKHGRTQRCPFCPENKELSQISIIIIIIILKGNSSF